MGRDALIGHPVAADPSRVRISRGVRPSRDSDVLLGDEAVVKLLAGIPRCDRGRSTGGEESPRIAIAGIRIAVRPIVLRAGGRQEVEADGAIAIGGFEKQHRLIVVPAHDMAEAELGSQLCAGGTLARHQRSVGGGADHAAVAHVRALGPVVGTIDEVGKLVLASDDGVQGAGQGAVDGSDADHVRLTGHDINFHGLVGGSGGAIRIRQRIGNIGFVGAEVRVGETGRDLIPVARAVGIAVGIERAGAGGILVHEDAVVGFHAVFQAIGIGVEIDGVGAAVGGADPNAGIGFNSVVESVAVGVSEGRVGDRTQSHAFGLGAVVETVTIGVGEGRIGAEFEFLKIGQSVARTLVLEIVAGVHALGRAAVKLLEGIGQTVAVAVVDNEGGNGADDRCAVRIAVDVVVHAPVVGAGHGEIHIEGADVGHGVADLHKRERIGADPDVRPDVGPDVRGAVDPDKVHRGTGHDHIGDRRDRDRAWGALGIDDHPHEAGATGLVAAGVAIAVGEGVVIAGVVAEVEGEGVDVAGAWRGLDALRGDG